MTKRTQTPVPAATLCLSAPARSPLVAQHKPSSRPPFAHPVVTNIGNVHRPVARTRRPDRLTRERSLMGSLSSYLHCSHSLQDAYAVISAFGSTLLPAKSGTVYLKHDASGHLRRVTGWGRHKPHEDTMTVAQCWALRLGHAHYVDRTTLALACPHIGARPAAAIPLICAPMIAEGETLGLLHLQEVRAARGNNLTLREDALRITGEVAQELAIALANLRLRETLMQQSTRDPLTGLYNRRFLQEFVTREIHRAERTRQPLSVIMLDIDRFKSINDRYGHAAGDDILRQVALVVEANIRDSDVACRIGGDEFAVLLPGVSLKVAHERGARIVTAVRAMRTALPITPPLRVTASLGVATYPEQGHTGDVLFRAADKALYTAKRLGRDRAAIA